MLLLCNIHHTQWFGPLPCYNMAKLVIESSVKFCHANENLQSNAEDHCSINLFCDWNQNVAALHSLGASQSNCMANIPIISLKDCDHLHMSASNKQKQVSQELKTFCPFDRLWVGNYQHRRINALLIPCEDQCPSGRHKSKVPRAAKRKHTEAQISWSW